MARKQQPDEGGFPVAPWMPTYADMVTLMFCFFVLLFASSNIDEGKYTEIASSLSGNSMSVIGVASLGSGGLLDAMGNGIMSVPNAVPNAENPNGNGESGSQGTENDRQEMIDMASDFQTYFGENNIQDVVDIEVSENYIKLVFAEGMFFDVGKADLKPEAKHVLDMIIVELKEYPNSDIRAEGHTDNTPISTPLYKNNLYLSNARAAEVVMYLMDIGGINPERVSSQGFGESRPIGDNQTEEGRAMNRRVEIKILGSSQSGVR